MESMVATQKLPSRLFLHLAWGAVIAALHIAASSASSVMAEPLSPELVVQSTLEHHPLLRATSAQQTRTEGELLSARGAFDPAIVSKNYSYLDGGYSGSIADVGVEQPLQTFGSHFFAGVRKSGGTFPIYDQQYVTNSGGETRVGIEVPLLRNRATDERRAKIAESEAKTEAARYDVEVAKIELARNALQAYWTWVAAGQRYKVFQGLVEVAEQRNEQLTTQVNLGDIAQFVLVDNQRALLKRKAELLKAIEYLQAARLQLALYLFASDGSSLVPDDKSLPSKLPPPLLKDFGTAEDRVGSALATRPELKSVAEKLRGIGALQELANNQLLPEVNAMLITADDHGSGDEKRGELEVKGGIQVKIPLVMRKARGSVAANDAAAAEVIALRDFYTQKIDRDVRKALIALDIVVQKISVQRAEVAAAKELEQGERTRFEQGDSNLIFVNLREQTTADAEVSLIDAILDYHVYRASLEAALGHVPRG